MWQFDELMTGVHDQPNTLIVKELCYVTTPRSISKGCESCEKSMSLRKTSSINLILLQ